MMSGESYALELLNGKCVPKRCQVGTYLRDGKCVGATDKRFAFTCRTGYIPDEANPGSPATGLHCLPDPAFCPPEARHRNGSCAKPSALAIDCFEARCVCGDPHADWVNYLCECTEPYKNVDGTCTARGGGAKSANDRTGEKPDEPAPHHRACAHGMIRTHAGCVPARRRLPAMGYEGRPDIGGYPGTPYYPQGSRALPFPGYPNQQQNQ
jgi:hypothetical protein